MTTAEIAADVAAFRAATPADVPALRAEDITVTTDSMGRDIVVIPDAVAAQMCAEIEKGWREFRGEADGESRFFAPGTWMYDTTHAIMTAYAASPVPAGRPGREERDEHYSRTGRERAGAYGQGAGAFFVIGRLGWDFDARWWRFDVRSPAHKALCPKAYPNQVTEAASGRVGYRWQG